MMPMRLGHRVDKWWYSLVTTVGLRLFVHRTRLVAQATDVERTGHPQQGGEVAHYPAQFHDLVIERAHEAGRRHVLLRCDLVQDGPEIGLQTNTGGIAVQPHRTSNKLIGFGALAGKDLAHDASLRGRLLGLAAFRGGQFFCFRRILDPTVDVSSDTCDSAGAKGPFTASPTV